MYKILSSTAVGLALLACDGGSGNSEIDSGIVDSGIVSDSTVTEDGGATPDAMGIDSGVGGVLPTTCSGDCTVMTLTAEFGSVTRTFDRAFFGMISPAQSTSGDWEFYLENGSGADSGCPSKASPTPRFLLISDQITGGKILETVSPSATTLVDFEGALLPNSTFTMASMSTIRWVAADPCIACAEGTEADRPDRMIAIDIDATFATGTIRGHAYATHCDSLDDL